VKRSAGSCRSCSLLLIADSSFYEEVGEMSVKQSVMQMLLHVREANVLMRRQDFDRDGASDCIGVHVSGIGVITSNMSVDNLLSAGRVLPGHPVFQQGVPWQGPGPILEGRPAEICWHLPLKNKRGNK